MEVFLVGGAVRDGLLGRPILERDWVVVGATPELLIEQGYRPVGRDFPVFLHPETGEEYALARTERKTGSGYHGFTCFSSPDVTLEEDLKRRDLTVNAMAQSTSGTIIDPYGGQQDLTARVLRHVSPAFEEDPLRVLRVARFATRYAPLGFTVAAETLALMNRMVTAGELTHLTRERVWQELSRALMETQPATFIRVLNDCQALSALFPEVAALFGVPNPVQWHPEIDSGEHTLLALNQAAELCDALAVRLAILLHDVGKAKTPPEQWPSHPGHEALGEPLAHAFCQHWRVPKKITQLVRCVTRHHLGAHRALELDAQGLLQLLTVTEAFKPSPLFEQFLLACEADFRGRKGWAERPYPQRDYLQQARAAAAEIESAPIVAAGFQGAAIQEELARQRLARLTQFCTHHRVS